MISVIINNYADHEECNATIKSIRETRPFEVDVVVIDDGSPEPYVAQDPKARVFRCERRIGGGASRALGVVRARYEWVLLVDSHMRFVPGWQEAVREVLDSHKSVVWCGQCLGLRPGMMDVTKAESKYNGATILFSGPDNGAPGRWQVLEGKWIAEAPGDKYALACLMGALYLVNREWFAKINALRWLRQWGSEEPSMSIRTWMLGGECRMLKGLKAGHQFRSKSFHVNVTGSNIYNKLRIAVTTMPEAAYKRIAADLPKQYKLPGDVAQAHRWLLADAPQIEFDRALMEENTKLPFEGYLERFGLPKFWE